MKEIDKLKEYDFNKLIKPEFVIIDYISLINPMSKHKHTIIKEYKSILRCTSKTLNKNR